MRLFIALDLPAELREAIGRATAQLRNEAPGARWSKPEALHVTLKFLGETDPNLLPEIKAALEPIVSADPVSFRLRGVGFFPDEKRPRVMWCGVDASPNLAELAAKIEKSLQPLGFEAEARRYVPHVTLARLRFTSEERLQSYIAEHALYRAKPFYVDRFALIASYLTKSGSIYEDQADYPLG